MYRPIIIGAERILREDGSHYIVRPRKDKKKTVAAWRMPEPLTHVPHFQNAAARAKYLAAMDMERAGSVEAPPLSDFTFEVPVYFGMDLKTQRAQRNKYRPRVATPKLPAVA
jgi:hypothetical protein